MMHRMVSSALTAAFPFDGLQVDVARAYAFSMAAFYLSHISYGGKKKQPTKGHFYKLSQHKSARLRRTLAASRRH